MRGRYIECEGGYSDGQIDGLSPVIKKYHGTSSLSPWGCGQVGKVGATSSTLCRGEVREVKGKNERVRKVKLVRKGEAEVTEGSGLRPHGGEAPPGRTAICPPTL